MTTDKNLIDQFILKEKAFAISRCVMTALELNMFPALNKKAFTLKEIIKQFDLNADLALPFLNVLETGGYLQQTDSRYSLTDLSRSILENYKSIRSWNEEMRHFYFLLNDLTKRISDHEYHGKLYLQDFFATRTTPDIHERDRVDHFSKVMDESQEEIANHISGSFDFTPFRRAIDIGGGYGRFAISMAKANPLLNVVIIDLHQVAEGAEQQIAEAKLASRVSFFAADMFSDPLPGKADLVTFVRILNDWNNERTQLLMRKAFEMLITGGTLMIVETMYQDDSLPDLSSSITGLMAAMLGGARRSTSQYVQMARTAGFETTGTIRLDFGLHTIFTAVKD